MVQAADLRQGAGAEASMEAESLAGKGPTAELGELAAEEHQEARGR